MKTTCMSLACSFIGVLAVSGHEPEAQLPFERPHAHASPEGHAHLGWESSYYSEGRDSLDGDSLFVGSLEMGWKHLAGGLWYGFSPDQHYDELQLSLAVSQSIGDFKFYGAYTHIRFPYSGMHDNELGAGVEWSGLPLDVELSADIYRSFDAGGYFVEISAGREFEITDKLTLKLSTPFGMNQGYVPDGHDGANHIALRLGFEYAIASSLSINLHATQSWALNRDAELSGDDTLIDFLHGGVGVEWKF